MECREQELAELRAELENEITQKNITETKVSELEESIGKLVEEREKATKEVGLIYNFCCNFKNDLLKYSGYLMSWSHINYTSKLQEC